VRLLLKAAAVREPPTPRENIIACAKMVESGEIDLESFRDSLLERGLRRLIERIDVAQLWKKVRGLFRYDDRIFYVDPTQHRHKQIQTTYHEAYHAIDPIHKEMSDLIHLDTDETLALWAKRKMEREANLGASLIRFQVDRLQRESRDLPTSMESICYLAGRFDASIHGTLRHYVECGDNACVMLVFNLEPKSTISGEPYYTLRYYLPSSDYESRFNVPWPHWISPGHWLFTVVNNVQPDMPSYEEFTITDLAGNVVPCIAQGFHNHYDILVFIYPKPKKTPKTQVIFDKKLSHQLSQGLTR
jgi:hypothetical protein